MKDVVEILQAQWQLSFEIGDLLFAVGDLLSELLSLLAELLLQVLHLPVQALVFAMQGLPIRLWIKDSRSVCGWRFGPEARRWGVTEWNI